MTNIKVRLQGVTFNVIDIIIKRVLLSVLRLSIQFDILNLVNQGESMVKTANLSARIEPELKNEAETILGGLGVPVSNAINMFYRQIVIHRGLPFAVKFPTNNLINAATLTDMQLDQEISKGFDDIASGRKRSLKAAADGLAREFSL